MERGAIDRVGRRPRPTFVRERARAMDARRGRRARGKYLCVLRARPLRPSSVAFASSSVASSSRIIFHSLLFIQSSENRNGCENGRARAFVPRRRRASRHGRPPTFLVHLLRAHRRRRRRRRRRRSHRARRDGRARDARRRPASRRRAHRSARHRRAARERRARHRRHRRRRRVRHRLSRAPRPRLRRSIRSIDSIERRARACRFSRIRTYIHRLTRMIVLSWNESLVYKFFYRQTCTEKRPRSRGTNPFPSIDARCDATTIVDRRGRSVGRTHGSMGRRHCSVVRGASERVGGDGDGDGAADGAVDGDGARTSVGVAAREARARRDEGEW